jgi:hypothetical protein
MIDFDEWFEKENALEIEKYETILSDDLPASMRERCEKWLRMLRGDEEALIELSIERGLYEITDEN